MILIPVAYIVAFNKINILILKLTLLKKVAGGRIFVVME